MMHFDNARMLCASEGTVNSICAECGDVTPKASANLSPVVGAERQPWVHKQISSLNPERVLRLANPFRVLLLYLLLTQGCRSAPTTGLN